MLRLILLLASVTPSQSLMDAQAQDAGIAAIAYRLQTSAVALCDDVVPQSGVLFHDITQYPASQRIAAKAAFGLDDRPSVLAVVTGSAADTSGLRVGDHIADIDRQTPSTARDAEAYLARAMASPPADIRVDRGGDRVSLVLTGAPGCVSQVQVIPGKTRNAVADGTYVQLTAPVIAEAKDDGELASIIAHEMAHNILKHRAWLNKHGRTVRNIRTTEIEADRLSVYLVASAGYDSMAPARFWTHFGKKTGQGIFSDGTHLRTKARVALLTAVAGDVAANKSFKPNLF